MSDKPLGMRAREAAAPVVPTVPSLAELARRAADVSGPKNDHIGHDDCDESHTFTLDYRDTRRGRVWAGEFRCHVPTVSDHVKIGQVLAGLRGNLPPMVLDDSTLNLTEMLATLTVLLDEAPAWCRGNALMRLRDFGLIGAIYKEVRDHLARFWGPEPQDEDAADAAKRPESGSGGGGAHDADGAPPSAG